MNRNCFVLLLVILFCFSCHAKQNNDSEQKEENKRVIIVDSLPEIDLLNKYSNKEIELQDIAEITYVPFETTEAGLINSGCLKYVNWSGDTIITYRDKTIYFFDSSGNFLKSFDRHGGSGSEYVCIQEMAVDFDSKEIFVYDDLRRYHILVYSFEGDYKRTLNLPNNLAPIYIFNYDENFLFCEDGMDMLDLDKPLNKNPYSLVSKKTGEITPLPLEITERIGKQCYFDEYLITFPIETILKTDSRIIISDCSMDTVYSLRNEILRPMAIRKNRISNEGYPILSAIEAVSNRYILWGIQERNVDLKKRWMADKRYLLFDKQSDEIFEVQMTNSDFLLTDDMRNSGHYVPTRYVTGIPENCIIQLLDAPRLIELYNQGHLNGRLKEIASKLQEEDNPVLALIKFKE